MSVNINAIIAKIYEMGTVAGQSGKVHELSSAVDREEGELLFEVIKNDPGIVKTLEVGCAHGLSSLHICSAIQERAGASHTIVDPFQKTSWDGVGIRNLEEAGIDFFNLIEVKSEFALPRLLEEKEGAFDFIFIDGWHTFDHTLLDCFYATRLLRVGGYLAIDDTCFRSIRPVVSFLKKYPCYEEYGSVNGKTSRTWKNNIAKMLLSPIPQRLWAKVLLPNLHRMIFETQTTRMIVLKKTKEDDRDWHWHDDTF